MIQHTDIFYHPAITSGGGDFSGSVDFLLIFRRRERIKIGRGVAENRIKSGDFTNSVFNLFKDSDLRIYEMMLEPDDLNELEKFIK